MDYLPVRSCKMIQRFNGYKSADHMSAAELSFPDHDAISQMTDAVLSYDWSTMRHLFRLFPADQWGFTEEKLHLIVDPNRRKNEDRRQMIMDNVRKRIEDRQACLVTLPTCGDHQVDSLLTRFVNQGLWEAASKLLQRGVSDARHKWAVMEVCKNAGEVDIFFWILPVCTDDELNSTMEQLLARDLREACRILMVLHGSRKASWSVGGVDIDGSLLKKMVEGRWGEVGRILEGDVTDEVRRLACDVASQRARASEFRDNVLLHCLYDQLDSVLTNLIQQRKWYYVYNVLPKLVRDTLCRWVVTGEVRRFHDVTRPDDDDICTQADDERRRPEEDDLKHFTDVSSVEDDVPIVGENESRQEDAVFWRVVKNCSAPLSVVCIFSKLIRKTSPTVTELVAGHSWSELLVEFFFTSILQTLVRVLCTERKGDNDYFSKQKDRQLLPEIFTKFIAFAGRLQGSSCAGEGLEQFQTSNFSASAHDNYCLLLRFFKAFSQYYQANRTQLANVDALLLAFACMSLFPDVQSIALSILMRENRWDLISRVAFCHVREQTRRQVFQAAVEQKQWIVINQWADHCLYDDQRSWALGEAFKNKQWNILLLLADHGLVEDELMRAHYRLGKYAGWNTVLHMFERGADVTEVRELLEGMIEEKRRKAGSSDITRYRQRQRQLERLEKRLRSTCTSSCEQLVQRFKWRAVFFRIIHGYSGDKDIHLSLEQAMDQKAWHVVMHLVKFVTDTDRRNSLFLDIVKRREWGVCRALLDHGLSVKVCLTALPELMELNQWTLVARVMEHDVGDTVRRQVLQRAMLMREGSVVWHCITTMKDSLSSEEREELFQQAFSREMWQAVKPLVEVKDEAGIRHRDEALLGSIERHRWDVVDHCQRYSANINMQDEQGRTPLLRASYELDWEAVEAIVSRDGDQALLGKYDHSPLELAAKHKQWSTVMLLIEFHGKINRQCMGHLSPLQLLIEARQGEIIERSLLWCADLCTCGVSPDGETALHAVCLSSWWSTMYYLICRKVDPLAVTDIGQSVLQYAVENKECPQKMVAECLKLGFSTHQPTITDTWCESAFEEGELDMKKLLVSPFYSALCLDLPAVAAMLYESGACSYRELFKLNTFLPKLYGLEAEDVHDEVEDEGGGDIHRILSFVKRLATTPRRLECSCRLLISHCLNVRGKLHRDVVELPLPVSRIKYVMFFDLADPDYGKDMRW